MVVVNGREYRLPTRPTVAITIDGCQPAYLDDGLARGLMPRLAKMLADGGAYHFGLAQMPTLTNPNNLSIVTGAPPSVHGVPGNHYLDPSGEEVQLVDPSFLRAPTIHAELRRAGLRVLSVTTKDKLRRLLASGGVPSTSAEKADEHGLPELGIDDLPALVGRPKPHIYDWDASHYALEIGLAAHRRVGLDLLYVSLTDYVQHKQGPGGELADLFYRRFDELLGEYLDAGFVVGITADHGMNPKQEPDGSPRVHYLEDVLREAGVRECRVVLPTHSTEHNPRCLLWPTIRAGSRRRSSGGTPRVAAMRPTARRVDAFSGKTAPPRAGATTPAGPTGRPRRPPPAASRW